VRQPLSVVKRPGGKFVLSGKTPEEARKLPPPNTRHHLAVPKLYGGVFPRYSANDTCSLHILGISLARFFLIAAGTLYN
jgi:hypothetical protein